MEDIVEYIVIFLCFLGTDQTPSKNNAKEKIRIYSTISSMRVHMSILYICSSYRHCQIEEDTLKNIKFDSMQQTCTFH
jgi:hypothetical protein